MEVSDVTNLYNYKKFSSDEQYESEYSNKNDSVYNEDEAENDIVERGDDVIYEEFISKKRGRPRKYVEAEVNYDNKTNYAMKKKILFRVFKHAVPCQINPIVNMENNNKAISVMIDKSCTAHLPKTNNSIKQRIFLQNNYNNCNTSTKTFFDREKKIKFLSFKN